MFETNQQLAETYLAVAECVPRARSAVAELVTRIGADRRVVEAVRLAVSEAVTNAVLHAYDGEPGPVHVRAAVEGDDVNVIVADEGKGMRLRPSGNRLRIGLALISRLADQLVVAKRPGGGTRLQMRFGRVSPRS